MAKKKAGDSRFIGERTHCGIKKMADGSYMLAPMVNDSLAAIDAEFRGLRKLQENTAAFVADRYSAIFKRHGKWWDAILADIGAEEKEGWSWDGTSIKHTPPAPEKKD